MSQWRLSLDVPFTFCVEQGFNRNVKSIDFRPDKGHSLAPGTAQLWQEPILGIVMLRPSCLYRSFTDDFKGLANWNYKQSFWQAANRARGVVNAPPIDSPQPLALLMAPVKPAGQRFELIEILLQQSIMAILADLANYDHMKWVLESTFTLAEDESFAFHYHGLTDEMVRKENWFCVAWDKIGLHFNHSGLMRVFQYSSDLMQPPLLLQEIEICTPGDILNRNGYFYFIPIPNVGLAVYHGLITQKQEIFGSSARSVSVRGKLVDWPTRVDGDGHPYLFASSGVRVGMNPYHPTLIGFQNVRFPVNTPGRWLDGAFALPYRPTLQPIALSSLGFGDRGTLAVALKNADGSAPWDPTASTAHLARMEMTLQTADAKYTPFCGSWNVQWAPVFASRATTPLTLANRAADGVDRLMRLEWSDNADGHFEGEAELLIYSIAGQVIAGRGDATFLLEYGNDGGSTWFVFTGGLAKEWILDVEFSPNWGTYYKCKVRLYDMWERFDETHVLWQQAFDGLSIADATNNTLTSTGFPPIAGVDFPADAAQTLQKAPDGSSWRFSPREGEKAQDILMLFMLYMRRQNVQYRLRFSWSGYPTLTNVKWIMEARPRNLTDIWSLVPFALSRNESTKTWDYSSLRLQPEPPEGNTIIVEGLTIPDPQHAVRVSVPPLVNSDSLTNTASPDYLGRTKIVKVDMAEVTDTAALAIMERRFYDAIAHARLKGTVESQHFTWFLQPNTRIRVYRAEGSLIMDCWIKRRTVVIENAEQETLRLEADTVWEEPIGRA